MLQLDNVSFSFAGDEGSDRSTTRTLSDISLLLEPDRVAAVMGESGCGKSTLLDLIYGLQQADHGTITWKGEELLGADHHLVPGHPMMKYVPQEFDLMPFTTVAENVGEHLSIQMKGREDRIKQLLEVVEMSTYVDRKVKTLSGGQKQRVAIAKALAEEPKLLLLDEPFSHVDNFRKNMLRRRLFAYVKEQKISCLIATHDKNDVLSFSDETIVMRQGAIIDHRETKSLYSKPKTIYVASLFDDVTVVPAGIFGNQEELLLYPHRLQISNKGYKSTVIQSYFKGGFYLIECQDKDQVLWVNHGSYLKPGETVFLSIR
ncbi:ABC transporter ATP-binding protein [Nonlabens ponticola]|uniref:ABC transporter ATP-binding protein n=1 Tax=Nonlabens ponticola TaxID=2496866 RepID=A0A3S9MVM8_9FLAO|nr:ABC transporter ATP-binding protein [Nonlabens ponticola]AZQ43187.1 ABC transporter ATP-binding protein [Nonlabens ponticola]